jgi:hypothetical protein
MTTKQEMLEDIREMLVLIKAFTKPDTKGEVLLNIWDLKYGLSMKEGEE